MHTVGLVVVLALRIIETRDMSVIMYNDSRVCVLLHLHNLR
jgi:hypothetical protein